MTLERSPICLELRFCVWVRVAQVLTAGVASFSRCMDKSQCFLSACQRTWVTLPRHCPSSGCWPASTRNPVWLRCLTELNLDLAFSKYLSTISYATCHVAKVTAPVMDIKAGMAHGGGGQHQGLCIKNDYLLQVMEGSEAQNILHPSIEHLVFCRWSWNLRNQCWFP